MLKDLGWVLSGEVWSDASAALGIINRNGLGKTSHIETGLLWIQQTAAQQRLKFGKVLGKDNPADLFTKHLDVKTMEHHMENLDYHKAIGRAAEAPKLHILSRSMEEWHCGNGTGAHTLCSWVNTIMEAMAVTRSSPAPWKWQNMIGYVGESGHKDDGRMHVYDKTRRIDVYDKTRRDVYDLTSPDQQVLWRSKWQVHGVQRIEFRPA